MCKDSLENGVIDRILKKAEIGVWEYDVLNDQIYLSDVISDLQEVDGKHPSDLESALTLFYREPYRTSLRNAIDEAVNGGISFDLDLKIQGASKIERWVRVMGEPDFKHGECTRIIGSTQIIDKQKKVEKDVIRRENRFKALVRNGTDLIAVLDEGLCFSFVSPSVQSILNLKPDNLLLNSALERIHSEDKERVASSVVSIDAGDRRTIAPYRYKNGDDTWRWIESSVTNLCHDPAVRGFVINSRDISEEKEEKERLKLLESVITHMTEAVVIVEARPTTHPDRKILYVNDAYCEITGYDREEVIGNTAEILHGPETDSRELEKLLKAMKEWRSAKVELISYRKNGEPFWMHVSVVPVTNDKGEYTHWISIERDVTERKRYQQKLLDSLKEKEVLLAEVHHRVMNNLAVISGMLQLQAGEQNNDELSLKLLDSVARIKTIATIHEQVYRNETLSSVNLARSIRNLGDDLITILKPDLDIDIEYDCDDVYVNISQAIPFSLVVNEIITNAIKHAFEGRESGSVYCAMKKDKGKAILQIEDDGVGMDATIDQSSDVSVQDSIVTMQARSSTGRTIETGLGFQIVTVLSKQLRGSFRMNSNGSGAKFYFEFPIEE